MYFFFPNDHFYFPLKKHSKHYFSSEVLPYKFKFWALSIFPESQLSSLSITKIPSIKKMGSLLPTAYLCKGKSSSGRASMFH